MAELLNEKENFSEEEWRCPNCGRLLGLIINNQFLEIESSNHQLIWVPKDYRKAICKCGVIVTVSGGATMVDSYLKGS
jgi:DhnA family fructose-bisphosphate aldolase class Ia